jgi:hypothetical protein
MRILLQNTKTGLYFQNSGVWTHELDSAFDFGHSQRAIDHARANGISEARVVASFMDGGYLHSVPFKIEPRQTRAASAARVG